jgi:hypothetical protein
MTFSTMNDDFVDARFDPEHKKTFLQELQNFDQTRKLPHLNIPIRYKGQFDAKSQTVITNLINEVIKNADVHKMIINHSAVEIKIFTTASWEKATKKPLSKNVNIPAAKIDFSEGTHCINLIIPEKITNSENIIKTIRLVCSKIFGDLFFDEHIPGKQVYKDILKQLDQFEFDIEEKVRFCRFLGFYPRKLNELFLEVSRKNNIKGPKALEIGKSDLYKSLLTTPDNADEFSISLINRLYIAQINHVKKQEDYLFTDFFKKCLDTCDQSTLLLPHEKKDYQKLQEQKNRVVFNSIAEKAQYVCNYIQELQECLAFLSEINAQNPMTHSTARLWKETLNQRMIHLKKMGVIKLFLIDGAKLTQNQQLERNQFPLWIWKHQLFNTILPVKSSKQAIDKITGLYKNSIYQKLFELSYHLIQALSTLMRSDKIVLSQLSSYAKIKNLKSWLLFRQEFLKDTLHACRVFIQIPDISDSHSIEKQQSIKDFNQGWAYFVSFALIHQYYLNIRKTKITDDFRDEKFYDVINRFTLNQINKPSFQVSLLLMEIYAIKSFKLSEITDLMIDDCAVLDFFVFNRRSILAASETENTQLIRQYASKVQNWQQKHYENKILL